MPETALLGGGEPLAEGVLMPAMGSTSRSTCRCPPSQCWGSGALPALTDTPRTKMGWEPVPGTAQALPPAQRGRCNKNIFIFQKHLGA